MVTKSKPEIVHQPPKPEAWEVMPLDSAVARQIRRILRLSDDDPIPLAIRIILTDFNAEPLGESLEEPMDDWTLKRLIQLAEVRYPSCTPIAIKMGGVVYSRTFSQKVIFVRPAPLDRALINREGRFDIVPVSDLVTNEDADPNSLHNQYAEYGKGILTALATEEEDQPEQEPDSTEDSSVD